MTGADTTRYRRQEYCFLVGDALFVAAFAFLA